MQPTDRIQRCIDHIKTALDVDPWAAELAETALKMYRLRGEWIPVLNGIDDDTNPAYGCSVCGSMYHFRTNYCPWCGAAMNKEEHNETDRC